MTVILDVTESETTLDVSEPIVTIEITTDGLDGHGVPLGAEGDEGRVPVWVGPGPFDYELSEPSGSGGGVSQEDLDAAIVEAVTEADGSAVAGLIAHTAAPNPHGQYALTSSLGTAAMEDASDFASAAEKGQANGFAGLDGSALLLDGNIPAAIARDSEVTAAISSAITTEIAARNTAIGAAISAIINGSPGAFDTFLELYNQLVSDEAGVAALVTSVAGKQPLHAMLTALSALSTSADQLLYFTGSNTPATVAFSAYFRTLTGSADASTLRGLLLLGTAATHAHGDYDTAGAAATAQSTAISTAAGDATTKANAAQAAAASDATTKANAAQAAAIAASVPLAYLETDGTGASNSDARFLSTKAARTYVAAAVAALVNSAPGTLDTLGELATQLASDESAVTALTTVVGQKTAKSANLSDLANAATARGNLGVAIGSDVQGYDAKLAAIAGLVGAADKGVHFTGAGAAALHDLTPAARTLLDDTSVGAMQTTLGFTAWTAFTPVWTGLTTTSGTLNLAVYALHRDCAHVRVRFTFGASSAVTGAISFTIPALSTISADDATGGWSYPGMVKFRDNDVATYYMGFASYQSAGAIALQTSVVNSTYGQILALSSAVPFTWATGDVIYVDVFVPFT